MVEVYKKERERIESVLEAEQTSDPLERKLAHQNRNPVKRVTSGLEGRSTEPITINGVDRFEVRLPWWRDYLDEALCVFGHYWRTALPGEKKFEDLFDGCSRNLLVGPGCAMCIDYSVGKRFKERLRPGYSHGYLSSLAALRLPEKMLIFDNNEALPLLSNEMKDAR